MPNRLSSESSLYLRQHADNPVEWWPWCDEAFEEALRRDVPVLVSIGYSACHWCHVMAHKCFEDAYIAQLMNEHFVCIKVDREERPDIDAVYMEAIQMITRRGGWPLNVFCLPDKRPFFGGTYFPPEDDGHGLIPWPQLLMRIADHYRRDRHELVENAEAIVKNIEHANTPDAVDSNDFSPARLIEFARILCGAHDDHWGGFGEAPKFPQPMSIGFLLAIRSTKACEADARLGERVDFVINRTLTAMARGGLFDQIGGGFTRYSVDQQWLIPHFEKMLYDNGQLVELYARAWLRYRQPLYEAVVRETVRWLLDEMRSPTGLFHAAVDADTSAGEGRYYVWSPDQVREILGDADGKAFCEAYFITESGNFEDGLSNPALTLNSFEARCRLAPMREALRKARGLREKPATDTKNIVAWNALAIRGLATAAWIFNEPDWFRAASSAFRRIFEIRASAGRLPSVIYNENAANVSASLSDHAYLAEAALGLAAVSDSVEAGSSRFYLDKARELHREAVDLFIEEDSPGYFFAPEKTDGPSIRRKDWLDNAIPSGTGSMIAVESAMAVLFADSGAMKRLQQLRQSVAAIAARAPSAVASGLEPLVEDAMGIPLIKAGPGFDVQGLNDELRLRAPRRWFLFTSDDVDLEKRCQVCIGTQCLDLFDQIRAVADTIAPPATRS